MLKQRVYTALALIALLGGSLFWAPAFLILTVIILVCGLWEWARLNSLHTHPNHYALIYAVLGLVFAWGMAKLHLGLSGPTLWWGVLLFWLGLCWHFLRQGYAGWSAVSGNIRLCCGFLLLIPSWLALQSLYAHSPVFLLSSLALVWLADIGAYFFGRHFGGRWLTRKLAPGISPKKTWEGVLGAVLCMLLGTLLWLWLEQVFAWPESLMQYLWLRFGVLGLVLANMAILGLAIVGDLFESLIKRSADVKDSSGLLPGHGGVLDRVDALLPTMPFIVLLTTL